MKLSAVRKVIETSLFLALGSFGTLGPKLSHGTSWIAEIIHRIISPNVRTHLRKVSKRSLSSIKEEPEGSFLLFSIHLDLKVKIVIDSKQLLA